MIGKVPVNIFGGGTTEPAGDRVTITVVRGEALEATCKHLMYEGIQDYQMVKRPS